MFAWWYRLVNQHRDTKPELLLPFVRSLAHAELIFAQEQASVNDFISTPEGQVAFKEEVIRMVQQNPKLLVLAAEELNKTDR